ncbi:DNA replication and repair protein RecF [Kushneria sinocarnis]|uniref:DNA replication and repair protein RecF n=1 Tax=Kushneria sinocarnis TaxID=595502 RepID=A0A420X0H8_9GAMM|nr:DNA replication/repair protein RecF [Kushneria sinocarnis]RKR07302.1 DNA replication and repair protein RecF [Kushneria sinocarnis]
MSLERLQLVNLRNLGRLDMAPGAGINLINGANGSGKTSLLEGIHILGLGRSFRTRQLRHAIAHDQPGLTTFGRLAGNPPVPLGVERRRDADGLTMRLAGERVERIAELARHLPLQLINPDAFRLIEGSPGARREFLDWGVFHMKHDFFDVWRRARRALKHRNALLRHDRIDDRTLALWSHELARWSDTLDAMRSDYMARFVPVFEATLAELIEIPELTLRYQRGWDRERSLATLLEESVATDRQMKFTQQGPQRADLRLRVGRHPGVEVLSRGQQKLVVSAMKLAQGRLLEQQDEQRCIYLIDDLAAELDDRHRRGFCRLLEQMNCQTFLTSIDPDALEGYWHADTPIERFHVKQGRLEHAEGARPT